MRLQKSVNLNINNDSLADLEHILNNISLENIHIYWLANNMKNDHKKSKIFNELTSQFDELLAFEKIQIAKIFLLNMIEQKILGEEIDTDLNLLLCDIKNQIANHGIISDDVMYNTYIHKVDTILNNESSEKHFILLHNNYYPLTNNSKYIEIGINAISNWKLKGVKIGIKDSNNKTYKKIQ